MESNININDLMVFSEDMSNLNVLKETQQQQHQSSQYSHRFKVVKLFTSEPYIRGRWLCRDTKDTNDNQSNTCHVLSNERQNILNNIQTNNQIVTNECQQQSQQTVTTPTTTAPTQQQQQGDSGSGVAIDNKIEQAMDLVKSHLMFAVREEVDVLKERIKELESEIHILRAHASQETLQLIRENQQQLQQNTNNNE